MKLGIFAKTFEGTDPAAVLKSAAEAGYTCVQYNMACSGLPPMPDEISEETARAVAEASKANGVEIVAVSGTYNMIHPDVTVRRAGHRKLAALAARCADMGTALITLCTGTRDPIDQWKKHHDNDTAEAWSDLLEAMEKAIEIADRHNIDLGIEPEFANVVNSADKAHRLIEELKSPRIKIVLDPANLFEVVSLVEQHNLVSAAIDQLADMITMAHAKDRQRDGSFATAGKGVLDYDFYLAKLNAIGFEGSLIAHGLAASEASDVATFLKRRLGQGRSVGVER